MSFDRLAAVYSYMEYLVFGKDLERCRFRYLDALSDSRSILILGEGDGRFLNRLLRHNEHARVDCVDNSPAMVRKAQALISTSGDALNLRVKFHRISIDKFNFEPNYYDAVVTHFFLDCFSGDQLSRLISNIGTSANDSCRWLVSDFHYPNSGFTRIRAKIWIWFLYAFFIMQLISKTVFWLPHILISHSPDSNSWIEATILWACCNPLYGKDFPTVVRLRTWGPKFKP
ncbi:MAG: class I SAM-dependent methyltransferase [Nitrospinaceae bacterium]